ncbi:MAG: hypothetical protein OEZ68_02420 [Gammaproteobacteria bacterium]|nr:hypothetical protein [Gammaproteobacteria bacterium]MDH5799637.1 hypothetical protein [Gammaproteobacteria bacterium]
MTENNYPMVWVRTKRFKELHGCTDDQMYWMCENLFTEGKHYKYVKVGKKRQLRLNIVEIDQWYDRQKSVGS